MVGGEMGEAAGPLWANSVRLSVETTVVRAELLCEGQETQM